MATTLSSSKMLLLLLLLLVGAAAARPGEFGGLELPVGRRTAVPEVSTNREVQELGRFSVEEYNRRLGSGGGATPLAFARVVEAQRQVVAGVKYFLRLSAAVAGSRREDEGVRNFDAVVVVKPWAQSKDLISFNPSGN